MYLSYNLYFNVVADCLTW